VWNKNEPKGHSFPPPAAAPTPLASPSSEPRREVATLGATIVIKGELSGDEDLIVHGRIEGKILFAKHSVTVGTTGRVKADIKAKSIRVAGQVEGNLNGEEELVIHQSGRVQGNITAPRVTLESGSKFKGSIDMELGPSELGKSASDALTTSASHPSEVLTARVAAAPSAARGPSTLLTP